MKKQTVLVTGGAGFIGSHLVDRLVSMGYGTVIFDNLDDQVHQGKKPVYLNKRARFIRGDVNKPNELEKALTGVDIIFHLASRVGVAQSNYKIASYTGTNVSGVANLLDIIVNKKLPIKKIVMTASMTSYGEGKARCPACGIVKPDLRPAPQLVKSDWAVRCPTCYEATKPVATDETTALLNNSIYSLTKYMQEQMLLLMGKMYSIPVVSLRCFNVYGPRQSLSNPYTGVTAIFISRLVNNNHPFVYEDGLQTRDFVSVHDVVNALVLSMTSESANNQVINIGSSIPTTIADVAIILASLLKKDIYPIITEEYRFNDIRHCFADITKAKKVLGWKPKVTLMKGFRELIAWSKNEQAVDLFEIAQKELQQSKSS